MAGGAARAPGPTATATGKATRPARRAIGGRPLVPVGPGQVAAAGVTGSDGAVGAMGASVPFVSPRRGGAVAEAPAPTVLPAIAPAEPVSTYPEVAGADSAPDTDEEPSVPDEARARIVADATADAPIDAGPGTTLHVRFAGSVPSERMVGAMEAFRAVMRDRPGTTKVVIHVPGPGGGEMELRRGVAYDAELLAEVRRRLGDGLVELRLASA